MVQVYDDLDRLVGTVSDAATGGIGATTQFSYDIVVNLREVVDSKNLMKLDANGVVSILSWWLVGYEAESGSGCSCRLFQPLMVGDVK